MIIARWHITARFGQKGKIIKGLQYWITDIGVLAGFSTGRIVSVKDKADNSFHSSRLWK